MDAANLDETDTEPAERADREGIGVDATAQADRTLEHLTDDRALDRRIRSHAAEKVDEEWSARDGGQRLQAADGEGAANARRKPRCERLQQGLVGPIGHGS